MTLKLRHKIVCLAAVSALFPVVVMSVMTFLQKEKLQDIVETEIDKLSDENLKYTAIDFYKTCEISNNILRDKTNSALLLADYIIKQEGGISLSQTARHKWDAVNQITKEKTDISLPEILIGNIPIQPNKDFRKTSPVVDEITKLTGVSCTIFQKMNEQGDMLRVATNVENIDGTRAIGTYISAVNSDGIHNPIITNILEGKKYTGRAQVVNSWYITEYAPLKDKTGEIIGAVFTGVKIDATYVKSMLQNARIGQSGYVAVIGGSGSQKGKYIISLNGKRDGEDVWETKDSKGNLIVKEIIEAAKALSAGQTGIKDYTWLNPGDTIPRQKTASYIYFEPWDWVIIPTMYLEDYSSMYKEVSLRINTLLGSIITVGVIFFIIATIIAAYLGRKISMPITKVAEIAGLIAIGDLNSAMSGFKHLSRAVSEKGELNENVLSKDETGRLIGAIVTMTKNLNSLVGEVQRATIHLVSTATEIAASSKEQEVTVNELGASTNEIVSSTKEISSTSQQLVNTMNEVAETSSNTASLAEAGRAGLKNMEKSMEQLASATASISSKLSIINEKTSNINNVITTITKVADQTNLLSLNAAIEAEKAGEYGKGFSVVAREIRRLADQTAVATLDIIKMVREMQSAVSSGVMGMDKFSEDVRQSVKETEMISGQIEGIIREVQGLPSKFDLVIDGMKQQTTGAQQISDSMVQLSECAHNTSDSLRSFNEAAVQLNNATINLQKEVATFKVR